MLSSRQKIWKKRNIILNDYFTFRILGFTSVRYNGIQIDMKKHKRYHSFSRKSDLSILVSLGKCRE